MFGKFIGIPLAFVIALAVHHYVAIEWDLVSDHTAAFLLGIMSGLCAYFLVCGIDKIINLKRDFPPPLITPLDLPQVFGELKQLISERDYGPFSWTTRTVSQEEGRIFAVLKFTEDNGPSLQLRRQIKLEIQMMPVPEDQQQPILQGSGLKGITYVDLKWYVDSPFNRVHVNEIQDDLTRDIQVVLKLRPAAKKVKSPFQIPDLVIVGTCMALAYCFLNGVEYAQRKIAKQNQRQDAFVRSVKEQTDRDAYFQHQQEEYRKAQQKMQQGSEDILKRERDGLLPQVPPTVTPEHLAPSPFDKVPSTSTPATEPRIDPNWTPPASPGGAYNPNFKPEPVPYVPSNEIKN